MLTGEPNRGVGGRGGEVVADQSLGLSAVRVCVSVRQLSSRLGFFLFFSFRWWLRGRTSCQCGHVPSREVTGILPWAGDLDLDGRTRPWPLGPTKWKWSGYLGSQVLADEHEEMVRHKPTVPPSAAR